MGTNGYDCVVIPGALKSSAGAMQGRDKICGRSRGLVTAEGAESAATICSRQCPFTIQFLSDSYEFVRSNEIDFSQDDRISPRMVYLGERSHGNRQRVPAHLHPDVNELLNNPCKSISRSP